MEDKTTLESHLIHLDNLSNHCARLSSQLHVLGLPSISLPCKNYLRYLTATRLIYLVGVNDVCI